MKYLKSISILCFLISLSSCSSGPLTEQDNNTTVEYQLDSPFQIQLEGDASGINKWVLVSKIEPTISLTNQSAQFNKDKDKKVYTFNFKVNTDGETNVVLVYVNDAKQLENDAVPLKEFQVKVIAGTMGRILSD